MDWHAEAVARRVAFERASERRLEAAWRERDRMLDGDGRADVEAEAKVYRCKVCSEEFTDRFRFSSHGQRHRPPSVSPRAPRRRAAEAKARPSPPAGHQAPANGGPPCPLCCQGLPAAVGVLAEQFQGEGVEEEAALRCAVLAWAGLRVPEG